MNTTSFKVFHVETESQSIQLSHSAWLERSEEFARPPSNYHMPFLWSDRSEIELERFWNPLLESPVRLRTVYPPREFEDSPFQRHDCAHGAIAISILCVPWFVAGDPTQGANTSLFLGEKTTGAAQIHKCDEDRLVKIYDFVYRTLTSMSAENDDAKLLFYFLKCVLHGPSPRCSVLKLDLHHLFTEFHLAVSSGALFLEHILTKKSRSWSNGLKKWNEFIPEAPIDMAEVNPIFQYRHVMSHSNATDAQRQILEWKKDQGHDDLQAFETIRRTVWVMAKACLRAIVLDQERYREFQKARPD
ncbi:MAG: hypothetical protein HYX68_01415 [Planctomycetes bacterium]|nr:hypothetical protein [Planctomycetota bacterium]